MNEVYRQLIEEYGVPALMVLIIISISFVLAGWAARITQAACTKSKIEKTLALFFSKLVRWTLLTVAAMLCLEKLGVKTASIAVVLGTVSLAIGLAFQGTLSNFASGLMLIIFRPFKVGDMITVGGQMGIVAEIDLFNTMIDTGDNRRIILPNSTVFGSTIENATRHDVRRADVSVGVEYEANLDRTREILTRAAGEVPGCLPDRPPQILLTGLGDWSVNWEVRVWCRRTEYWDVRQAVIRAVKNALDEAGISIPFPIRDVRLRAGSTALTDGGSS